MVARLVLIWHGRLWHDQLFRGCDGLSKRTVSFQDLIHRRQRSSFVGREDQITLFKHSFELAVDDEHRYPIFNIYGDGGVGKTFLFKQLRAIIDEKQMLQAYTDEYVYDVPETMATIAVQLGRGFRDFNNRYSDYMQQRDRLLHDPQAPLEAWGRVTRTAVKVALHASKGIPGAAPIVDLVNADEAADAAEEVRAYLSRKLSNSKDVRLLMNPIDELTPHFVRCLAQVGMQHNMAILFDTYERTSPILETWLLDLLEGRFGELPASLIVAIAGRNPLDPGRWSDYIDVVAPIQLTPFTEKEARQLLSLKGVTAERVVKTILAVSGRLPLLVALLAEGRPHDPDDVGDPSGTAVERFLRWEHDPQRRDAALMSALPRQIDADILGVLTESADARALFRWLCGLPFVSARAGRYEYHDIVRAPMIRIQRAQSPQRWRDSHRRLADAHRTWREGLSGGDSWLNVEWFYHRSEEAYHRLCAAPTENLPDVLNLAVAVAKAGTTVARRWAEMLHDAGRDTENSDATEWGERLLAAIDEQHQECSDFLSELLISAPLTSLARVEALVERGRVYYSLDREMAALADLTEAIRTDPNISRAWEYRGDTAEAPASIAVDAYLDTDDSDVAQKALAALDELAALLGYDGPYGEQTLRGSLFRRSLAMRRASESTEEVHQRLIQAELALELASMDATQAHVDLQTTRVVERLLSALTDVPQACVRIGSLLLIKYQTAAGPTILVRTLSQIEVNALEQYPEIQKQPERMLDALALAVENIESGQT